MTAVQVGLAAAFLQLAKESPVETHNIAGLGEVGLLQLSLQRQQNWSNAAKDMGAIVLIKNTVCDPVTRELVLLEMADEELKNLPLPVVNSLLEKIYIQNGIKTKDKNEEGEELKNSKADQS